MDFIDQEITLSRLQKMPSLSKSEILEKLASYAGLFYLRLDETALYFPEYSLEELFLFTEYVHGKYFLDGVPYEHIVHIYEDEDCLYLFLRGGEVFLFRQNASLSVRSLSKTAQLRRERLLSQIESDEEPDMVLR